MNVPSPDDIPGNGTGFMYGRLGVRIPTIAISPWIKKGTLVHDPSEGHTPTPDSQWELSSIVASVQKALGLHGGPLTKRDAWAASFEHLWEPASAGGAGTDAPRTDCPTHMPELPLPNVAAERARQTALPVDDTDRMVQQMLCDMHGDDRATCAEGVATKGQSAAWRAQQWKRWMEAS